MASIAENLRYFGFRDNLAADLRNGIVEQNAEAIMERVRACSGLPPAEAAEFVERFLADLRRELARKPRR